MEIKIADTFTESLKKMIDRQRFHWRVWDTIRYDIPRFIQNIWYFRKSLWNTYWWDHHGPLMHLQLALDRMAEKTEKYGLEVDESRLKKVAMMRRASHLIKNYNEDLYIDMAEAELGEIIHHPWEFEDVPDKPGYSQLVDNETPEEKAHNRKVFDRAREIQETEWAELWRIIEGQDYSKFENGDQASWDSQFDGSGIRGWWD